MPTLRDSLTLIHDRSDPRELAVITRLAPYLFEAGHVAECARLFARCPTAAEVNTWTAAESHMWATAMRAEAIGYGSAGDVAADIRHDLEIIRRDGPATAQLAAMRLAAHVLDKVGEPEAALAVLDHADRFARECGAPYIAVEFTYMRAMLAHLAGRDTIAADLIRHSLAESTLHENHRISLYAQMLASLAGVAGPPGGTISGLRELLDAAIDLGDRRQAAWLTASLGAVATLDGAFTDAANWFLEALPVARPCSYAIGTGFALMGGAAIAALNGDAATALLFHGAVEHDLGSLRRAMPRAYLDPYRDIAASLDDAQREQPELAAYYQRGRTSPTPRILDNLTTYFQRTARADR